jgi:hypothetical protein
VWLVTRQNDTFINLDDFSDKSALSNTTKSKLIDAHVCDQRLHFGHNELLDRRLDHNIYIRYRDNFVNDGSQFNESVCRIADHSSRYLYPWGGPIVAHGVNNSASMVDLVPSDLRHIADYFNTFNYEKEKQADEANRLDNDSSSDSDLDLDVPELIARPSLYDEFKERRSLCKDAMEDEIAIETGTAITVVRINCDADVEVDLRPRFESSQITPSNTTFTQEATDISKHISLPIFVRRIPGSADTWATRTDHPSGMVPWVNVAGTFLYRGCQPEREDDWPKYGWAFAPGEWQNSVGAVWVARQDKKELLPEHVEALAEYCQHHLGPFFEAQMESEYFDVRLGKDYVMKEISQEKFEAYFHAWMALHADPAKCHIVSPYA